MMGSDQSSSPSETAGAVIPAENGPNKAILGLMEKSLDAKCFDAVVLPVEVPAGDSYAYVLIRDKSVFENASPLPPVMAVSGAKALSSITRFGRKESNLKIAAVLRPCEIAAAIELSKLEQVDLTNMILISMDCPGVLPMSDFISDPKKAMDKYQSAVQDMDASTMRPTCQVCDRFGSALGDIHIGIIGSEKDGLFIIPTNQKGIDTLSSLGMDPDKTIPGREDKINEHVQKRRAKKDELYNDLSSRVKGIDNLMDVFDKCINCHNCMRVCPVCYCQQCYFDSENIKNPPEDYLGRAEKKGSLRFPPDTLLYHVGRMMHMSHSCVACGCCSDACPVSIPVAQIYSMIGQQAQKLFDYVPGRDLNEPRPLQTFDKKELQEVEE